MKPLKHCKAPSCKRPSFSHGYCADMNHQALRTDEAYLRKKAAQQVKEKEKRGKRVPVRKVSKKRANQLAQYSKRMPQWKLEHPVCEYPGCEAPTVDLHHAYARDNEHLNDEKFWIALCRHHHELMKLESTKSLVMGLIYLRSAKKPDQRINLNEDD